MFRTIEAIHSHMWLVLDDEMRYVLSLQKAEKKQRGNIILRWKGQSFSLSSVMHYAYSLTSYMTFSNQNQRVT